MQSGERGVVIGSPLQLEMQFGGFYGLDAEGNRVGGMGFGNFSEQLGLVNETLRRSLLYFDFASWPVTQLYRPTLPGIDVLVEQGYLQRPEVFVAGAVGPPDASRGASYFVFNSLERESPGCIVFAQIADEPDIWGQSVRPQPDLRTLRGLQIDLYNKLPVPAPEVSWADILDFKDRRLEQLLALRRYMNSLYDEICSSADFSAAARSGVDQLNADLSALSASMRERGMAHALARKFSLKALLDAGRTGVLAERLATLAQIPATYTSAVGAGAAGLQLVMRSSDIVTPLDRKGPLAYIAAAEREGVVPVP
ncbi:MAG: hypothetical protein JSS29_10990 [Proteobacteria bacterium]|nr:hypothetical protein [Pseudomonadota bacterium]